ncbi:ABC transporter ATP-binding protein [Brenneria tiliae]|uniref:ABC transporter ATP-binding protein n=1 Tax=Brenneria tiliae TaxID=2914984 RepID=UPI002014E3C6|nr:ABC transporter ATP-binding protein [Brenneria tiliae]MCL2898760.1 ABC transporter ATP-binding protein [Brenneria tiliae]MCL2903303.1 ABC transporter ATP-binding protein [Brenneria tiliae]
MPILSARSGREGQSPAKSSTISVRGVQQRFTTRNNSVTALTGVDIEIPAGQFLSIVGPSGCGKSTLLRLIGGLDLPSAGEILIDDVRVRGPRREIGTVFQTPVLFPWRTALENVLLPAVVRRQNRKQATAKAHALLEAVQLSGFEKSYPAELSGGMQQRVGIARALASDPGMLLMDEPFGALDALTRETLNDQIQQLWLAQRQTVVFVTHSVPEAIFLSDRVLVMSGRPGQIRADIAIDLPRPRTLADTATTIFGAYAEEIRGHLNANGRLD